MEQEKKLTDKFTAILKAQLEFYRCKCPQGQSHGDKGKPAKIAEQPAATHSTEQAAAMQPMEVLILGDSITQDLAPNGIAKLAGVEPKSVRILSKSGAVPSTVREPEWTLPKSTTTKIVLHAGTNCLTVETDEQHDQKAHAVHIASEITAKLDTLSEKDGASLYFSSILHRYDIGDGNNCCVGLNCLIAEANAIVKTHCGDKDYTYIDNDNLEKTDLYDGLHTNTSGAKILANNIGKALRGQLNTRTTTNGGGAFTKMNITRHGNRPSQDRRRQQPDQQRQRRPARLGDYWPNVHEAEQSRWHKAPRQAWREPGRWPHGDQQQQRPRWREAAQPAWRQQPAWCDNVSRW